MTNTNTAAAEKSAANDQGTSLPSKDQTRRNQDLAKESNDARAGLPEGRTMKLDDSKKRKAGVSLAGGTAHNLNASRIKDGDKVAAATASSTSSIMGLIPRRKELSEEKKTKLLEKARARGLSTEGWNVFWDTKLKWHRWISPNERILDSIPQALAYVEKQKTRNAKPKKDPPPKKPNLPPRKRKMSQVQTPGEGRTFDHSAATKEAKERGLPDGWGVEWNDEVKKRRWVAPDGRTCSTLTQALAHCEKIANGNDRVLSPQEVEVAMKQAKARGLPEGFTVVWDVTNKSKKWIAPNGRVCTSIPKALKMARQMGILPLDTAKKPKLNRILTYEEKCAALEEAKGKGLPEGWTVIWDNEFDQRKWTAPDGRTTCGAITTAIALSKKLGLLSSEAPKLKRGDRPTEEQMAAKLREGKIKGLLGDWSCFWDDHTQRTKWRSPKGKSYRTLTQALAASAKMNDVRVLTPNEKAAAIKGAKAKGLPEGWSVTWDSNNGSKKWTAPDGRIATTLPKALAMSAQMGMVPPSNAAPIGNRVLTEEEQATAMKEAKNRGLPDGFKVYWCNRHQMRRWVSPGGCKNNSVPHAMKQAVKEGLLPADTVIPRGRAKNLDKALELPPGWTSFWSGQKHKRRKWRYLDGRECRTLPEALAMSVEMNLLPADICIVRPRKGQAKVLSNTTDPTFTNETHRIEPITKHPSKNELPADLPTNGAAGPTKKKAYV